METVITGEAIILDSGLNGIEIDAGGQFITLATSAGTLLTTGGGGAGLLRIVEDNTNTNGAIAGQHQIWVRDDAPTTLMQRDDESADWVIGYALVSVNTTMPTATAATTNLSCGGAFPIPADTARIGAFYRATGQYLFEHTAAATPVIVHEWLVDGVVVDTRNATPIATAADYHGRIIAEIRFQTLGATGTAMCSMWLNANQPVTYDFGVIAGTSGKTLTTVDTTQALTIELRVRMVTGVASNILTVIQGFVERLA